MIVWPVWPVRHNSSEFGYKTAVFRRDPPRRLLVFDFELGSCGYVVFDVSCHVPRAVGARRSGDLLCTVSRGPADAGGRWSGPLTAVMRSRELTL